MWITCRDWTYELWLGDQHNRIPQWCISHLPYYFLYDSIVEDKWLRLVPWPHFIISSIVWRGYVLCFKIKSRCKWSCWNNCWENKWWTYLCLSVGDQNMKVSNWSRVTFGIFPLILVQSGLKNATDRFLYNHVFGKWLAAAVKWV